MDKQDDNTPFDEEPYDDEDEEPVTTYKRTVIGGDEEKTGENSESTSTILGGAPTKVISRKRRVNSWKKKGAKVLRRARVVVLGTDKVGMRRRVTVLAALIVVGLAAFNATNQAPKVGATLKLATPASTAGPTQTGVSTRGIGEPTGTVTNVNAIGDLANKLDTSDEKFVRNAAHDFGERMWTYDFRFPEEYTARLRLYSSPSVMTKVESMASDPENQTHEVVESGFVTNVSFTLSEDHKSATAIVTTFVDVLRRINTAPVETPTIVNVPTATSTSVPTNVPMTPTIPTRQGPGTQTLTTVTFTPVITTTITPTGSISTTTIVIPDKLPNTGTPYEASVTVTPSIDTMATPTLMVHGQRYAPTDDKGIRTDYQTYNASVLVSLTLTLQDGKWIVTDYTYLK